MRNKNIDKVLALGLGLTLAGCAAKNSSAPMVQSSLKMTGASSAATVANHQSPKSMWGLLFKNAYAFVPSSMVDSTGAVVSLASAWTVIKEIEFKSEEGAGGSEDLESEVEFKGPYFVDLLSNTPVSLDTQMVTQKNIRRIKMKLEATHAALPAGAPAELSSNSIYFAGSVGGNSFKVQLDDGTEVQIAGPNSFRPSSNSEILVEFQIANIFKQINLSSVTNGEVISHSNRHVGSNLCASIDASAGDLYTCFRKGLEKHADFGVDRNGDDSLDNRDDHVK